MRAFMQALFEAETLAAQAPEIGQALLEVRSLRRTGTVARMRGSFHAASQHIHRFLRRADPRPVWKRLFSEQAPFVLADVTEIERPEAYRTSDGGLLPDGRTQGFWRLLRAPRIAGAPSHADWFAIPPGPSGRWGIPTPSTIGGLKKSRGAEGEAPWPPRSPAPFMEGRRGWGGRGKGHGTPAGSF
jgi:hypothetical protein